MSRKPPVFEKHLAAYMDAIEQGLSRGYCHYVSDGDTADFLLDLGYYQYAYTSLRLLGVNTPELHGTSGPERDAAFRAKARAEALILHEPVLVRSYKDTNSFERFIAEVYFSARPSESASWPDSVDHVAVSGRIWWSLGKVLVWEGLGE